jgi:hypothetical protein
MWLFSLSIRGVWLTTSLLIALLQIMGRLAANRVIPAHNPLATTPQVRSHLNHSVPLSHGNTASLHTPFAPRQVLALVVQLAAACATVDALHNLSTLFYACLACTNVVLAVVCCVFRKPTSPVSCLVRRCCQLSTWARCCTLLLMEIVQNNSEQRCDTATLLPWIQASPPAFV